MPAKLLDGEALAAKIKAEIKKEIENLKGKGITPRLVAVQVGENPASRVYVNQQKKACEEIGFIFIEADSRIFFTSSGPMDRSAA